MIFFVIHVPKEGKENQTIPLNLGQVIDFLFNENNFINTETQLKY